MNEQRPVKEYGEVRLQIGHFEYVTFRWYGVKKGEIHVALTDHQPDERVGHEDGPWWAYYKLEGGKLTVGQLKAALRHAMLNADYPMSYPDNSRYYVEVSQKVRNLQRELEQEIEKLENAQ